MGLKMTRELANSSWKNLSLPLSCPSARIQMRKEPPGATVNEGHGAQLGTHSQAPQDTPLPWNILGSKREKKYPENINSRNPTIAFHERLGELWGLVVEKEKNKTKQSLKNLAES